MIRVLFVCLGNICRSPMGEFIMKDKAQKGGWDLQVASAGTSAEEEGSPVYPPARRELALHGIGCEGKRAAVLKKEDYKMYDYILCMESSNKRSAERIFGGDPDKKVFRLLDFSDSPKDIADPWYTRDFKTAYREIETGIECFLRFLSQRDLL